MIDNTSQAGMGEWLRKIFSYLKAKMQPTSPKKYIELHKPKDEDERTWVLRQIEKLRENPGFEENPTYKMLRDYAMSKYDEYGQSEKKKPKEKVTYPY
jgi:hypothetical protein